MTLQRCAAVLFAALGLGIGLAVLADDARESTDLDSVHRATPRSLESMSGSDSAADAEAAPPPAAAKPDPRSGSARDEAGGARDELARAKDRLDRANAAYSEMQARHYPSGDARAKIVQERDEAQRAYQKLSEQYGGDEALTPDSGSEEEEQD